MDRRCALLCGRLPLTHVVWVIVVAAIGSNCVGDCWAQQRDWGCGAEACDAAFCDSPHCDPGFFEADACAAADAGMDGCDCLDCQSLAWPSLPVNWRRFDFFAGMTGFTGPANQLTTAQGNQLSAASFGFYEGLNEGRTLKPLIGLDLSAQLGFRATQTNLSGSSFSDETHHQAFVTSGLFHVAQYGWQYGAVVDYRHDDWWYRASLLQLRGEISWNQGQGSEFGYQFMVSSDTANARSSWIDSAGVVSHGRIDLQTTNQHRLFWREQFSGGAVLNGFAGVTDRGDGLVGGAVTTAFHREWAVQAGSTFQIPSGSGRGTAGAEESWNLSVGLVFRPGGRCGAGKYNRPLFDVADNGSFLVDHAEAGNKR